MSVVVQKVGGLEVLSYGKILVDARYCKRIGNKVHVFPVGFCTRRRGPGQGGKGEASYTSSIVEGSDGPEFTVDVDDEAGVTHRGASATAVWSTAVGARRGRETDEKEGREIGNGAFKFGYTIDSVAAELQKLPGYDALVALAPKAHSKADEAPVHAEVAVGAKAASKKSAPRKKDEAPPSVAAAAPPAAAVDLHPIAPTGDDVKPKSKRGPKPKSTTPAGGGAATATCPDCGLSSQFCPMSGAVHAFWWRPCPLCNLQSAFCCQTGQSHAPIHQLPPGSTSVVAATTAPTPESKARGTKKHGAKLAPSPTVPTSAEGASGTVAAVGDAKPAAKKRRTEKQPKAGGTTQVAAEASASGDLTQPIEKNAAAGTVAAPAPEQKQGRKRQRTLDEMKTKGPGDVLELAAEPKADPVPPPPPPPPKPFVYPPLKAVASKLDHTIFKAQILPSDGAVKARMEASGATTAVAQKRYIAFLAAYTTEKTIQDAARANKAAINKAPDAAADANAPAVEDATASNVDAADSTDGMQRAGSKRAASSRAPKGQSTSVEAA